MAARIPRFHMAGTAVADKCFLSVYTRIPPCLLIKPASKKQVAHFLCMTGSIDGMKNPWKSEPFREDVFFCLFQNVISRYLSIAPPPPPPELSYYGCEQACVLQNVFCAPPSPIVLRLRVSSSAYLSVLQSRPPPRHRSRVYYSLQ